MAIESILNLITLQEFKDSKFYDENLFNDDTLINLAIEMATSNIDYLSGFRVSELWPTEEPITPTDFIKNIKLAVAHYVRYALSKDVDYIRGQQSLSISGISEAINNPNDPLFIPPEVFNYLRKAKVYNSFQGYKLKEVEPRNHSFFSKFIGNQNEDTPLNEYLRIPNLLAGSGIKITKSQETNIIGELVTISAALPDISDYETKEDHNIDIKKLQDKDQEQGLINDLFKQGLDLLHDTKEEKTDHKTDIDNLQTQINNIDIPDLSDYETKADHKTDIDTLQTNINKKVNAPNGVLGLDMQSFDATSTIFVQALTRRGTSEYITFDQVKAKQDKTDNTLNTTDKTIVGAINENKTAIDNLTEAVDLTPLFDTSSNIQPYGVIPESVFTDTHISIVSFEWEGPNQIYCSHNFLVSSLLKTQQFTLGENKTINGTPFVLNFTVQQNANGLGIAVDLKNLNDNTQLVYTNFKCFIIKFKIGTDNTSNLKKFKFI